MKSIHISNTHRTRILTSIREKSAKKSYRKKSRHLPWLLVTKIYIQNLKRLSVGWISRRQTPPTRRFEWNINFLPSGRTDPFIYQKAVHGLNKISYLLYVRIFILCYQFDDYISFLLRVWCGFIGIMLLLSSRFFFFFDMIFFYIKLI